MKYIITDQSELRLGGAFHQDMADTCAGKVVRAGHCAQNADGTYRVWGASFGFNIMSQPEDAEIIRQMEDNCKLKRLGVISEVEPKQITIDKLSNHIKTKADLVECNQIVIKSRYEDFSNFVDKYFTKELKRKRQVRRLRIVQGILWVFIIAILIYEIYIHTL